ncbi:zinc finger protein 660-like [Sitodiplosis mosellana]|uniref:zinc finger protein 660-like n=1 Tax=Sitodiplosis mosellana TaxID=263140 RepID=UPI0024448744|nr:zinc finger protein 660-like [Sitodiplosis mosellana]
MERNGKEPSVIVHPVTQTHSTKYHATGHTQLMFSFGIDWCALKTKNFFRSMILQKNWQADIFIHILHKQSNARKLLVSVLDMDPGEGTSDGRVKRKANGIEVEIKQEPDIKEEPSDDSQFVLVTRSSERFVEDAATMTSNIELMGDPGCDLNLDFDLNFVKEEVKCEEEKPEKYSSADSSSKADKPNAHAGQSSNSTVKSKGNRNRLNSSVKKMKRDGLRKQNKRKIPRNKAAKKRKEHKCHVCGYVASCESNLTKHIRVHTGDKPYTCDVCSRSFTQKSVLNRHKKIHSGEKTFVCSVCSKSFALKCTLNRHLLTHNDDLTHSCLECGQQFATEDAQKLHERRCKQRRYECYLCKYKSSTKGNLKRHMQAKHTDECKFQCEVCGKKCIYKGDLNRHLAIHRNQFPFGCTKCRRGFVEEEDKTAHETICSRRQYQCYICEYSTLYMTNLRIHIRVHHTGEKPFECKWCDMRFGHKQNSKFHMKRIHHAEK